jgi:hypothetical protein
MSSRWLWRDDVCNRLSEEPPLWAEWVRWDGHVWSRRHRALVASLDAVGSIVGAGVATEKRDGTIWVVVYRGWMVCARRGDPLHIIWHAPLDAATRVTTRRLPGPLDSLIGNGADAWVDVTVEAERPFTFAVRERQVDGLLAAIAAAGRAGAP